MTSNPLLDLHFCREVSLSPAQIWEGWTNPTILMKWFCPQPWKVVECDIDLRPGGSFRTVMQSPEGERTPEDAGTFLLIEPYQRLIWTNSLGPNFRPKPNSNNQHLGFFFVVDLILSPLTNGSTRYSATVMHQDEASRSAHEEMGFQEGWGVALDQLVELMQ